MRCILNNGHLLILFFINYQFSHIQMHDMSANVNLMDQDKDTGADLLLYMR